PVGAGDQLDEGRARGTCADHLRAADLSEEPLPEEDPAEAREIQKGRDRRAGCADAETRNLEKAERKVEKVDAPFARSIIVDVATVNSPRVGRMDRLRGDTVIKYPRDEMQSGPADETFQFQVPEECGVISRKIKRAGSLLIRGAQCCVEKCRNRLGIS